MTSSHSQSLDITSVNVGFLEVHDPFFVYLATQAEDYLFACIATAIFKLRQWIEILARQIAGGTIRPSAHRWPAIWRPGHWLWRANEGTYAQRQVMGSWGDLQIVSRGNATQDLIPASSDAYLRFVDKLDILLSPHWAWLDIRICQAWEKHNWMVAGSYDT